MKNSKSADNVIIAEKNRYGDIFLKVPHHLADIVTEYFEKNNIEYDPEQGYYMHLETSEETTPRFPDDFWFITGRSIKGKNIVVYANETVLRKVPKIINDKVLGATTVLTVSTEMSPGKISVVFVKDRTKDKLTNPAGTKELDETYEQCAIREVREETGVHLNKALSQIGYFQYVHSIFDIPWDGEAMIYQSHATLTEPEMKALLEYQCDEIEKVVLVELDCCAASGLKGDPTEINGIPISSHHLLCAQYVAANFHGKQFVYESPKYLKNFVLKNM